MQRKDLRRLKTRYDHKMMLDAMQIQQTRWPTIANLNETIRDNVILP